MKEYEYDYEQEALRYVAEIKELPTSLRPQTQLMRLERIIAEACGGLQAGTPLDFTYEDGEWKGYRQIGIITVDEHMIFLLKCCQKALVQEMQQPSDKKIQPD